MDALNDLSPTIALKRTSTSRQLYDVLRGRIISLDLPPGMHLSRSEIALAYGVSQTPVRDALQMLEAEGLVVVYPQSRTEVTRIDLRQARETQFLRLSLELEVIRYLTETQPEAVIKQADRLVALQETALNVDHDLERFALLDRQFHQTMFEGAGVADLWVLVQSRSGHIDRLRKLNLMDPGKAGTILYSHREIIDNVRDGDVPRAQEAVRRHLTGTLATVDAIREAHTHFF
ncbi:GntR family transcriptional regulator [Rhizobium mongolense]|uniref:DNA-binding GntR family transcriptional regulator n=1 Tax=Rhizobium mongolense TaxID=57676 RepID=A0A7W6RQS3_9HYPH|nr:GntR family transcriptional regulator [Rhizobium mongolense]MBB4276183.1 DNA-binding GntR family transcriptional regulator [Rhizobium mongolense]